MKNYRNRIRVIFWPALAGAAALLSVLGLVILLGDSKALAQSTDEPAAPTSLTINKTVNLSQAAPGDVLTYVVTIQNAGDAAGLVLMTDTLPSELTVVPGSLSADDGSPTLSGSVITWQHTFLEGNGTTYHITVSAQITSGIGSDPVWITNAAVMTGAGSLQQATASTLAAGSLQQATASTLAADTYYYYLPIVSRNYPPIPTLNAIPNPDASGNYVVSWVAVDWPAVDRYVLQESTSSSFGSITDHWTTTGTSQPIQHDPGSGTFYYRVRADDDDYWGEGPYSNIQSVTLRAYYYDFNHVGNIVNPWPIRRTSYWNGAGVEGIAWTLEPDDHLDSIFILMADKWDFAIGSPMEIAPSPPYVIETRAAIHDPSNLVSYGVVFGGNGGSPCPAYRETGCFSHYYRLNVVWNGGSLKYNLKRIDYHEADKGHGRGPVLIGGDNMAQLPGNADGFHIWKIVVKPTGIDLYYDGALQGSTTDTTYVNEPYFGIFSSTYEYKPGIGRYDWFNVFPDTSP